MRFWFEGQEYGFYFKYGKPEMSSRIIEARSAYVCGGPCDDTIVGGGANQEVFVCLYETTVCTTCHLSVPDKAAEHGWREIKALDSHSSVKDQFSRKIGRSVALGRFKHDNPFVKYRSIRGKDKKHVRWEFEWGNEEKGRLFYEAMVQSMNGRQTEGAHSAP